MGKKCFIPVRKADRRPEDAETKGPRGSTAGSADGSVTWAWLVIRAATFAWVSDFDFWGLSYS
jgi:hypothetical protein